MQSSCLHLGIRVFVFVYLYICMFVCLVYICVRLYSRSLPEFGEIKWIHDHRKLLANDVTVTGSGLSESNAMWWRSSRRRSRWRNNWLWSRPAYSKRQLCRIKMHCAWRQRAASEYQMSSVCSSDREIWTIGQVWHIVLHDVERLQFEMWSLKCKDCTGGCCCILQMGF